MPTLFTNTQTPTSLTHDYVVVGAGPSAICALVKIYSHKQLLQKILWIDPEFKVGNFGTTLSKGSSVPGNTAVSNYLNVLEAIYKLIPECSPAPEKKIIS